MWSDAGGGVGFKAAYLFSCAIYDSGGYVVPRHPYGRVALWFRAPDGRWRALATVVLSEWSAIRNLIVGRSAYGRCGAGTYLPGKRC